MSDASTILFHLMPREEWERAKVASRYAPPSLELEGFIHCSGSPEVALEVGNRYYRDTPGNFIVLLLDQARIAAPVQWDAVRDTTFPHIYGELNLDAVIDVIDFPRDPNGAFLPLPIPRQAKLL